MAHLLGAILLTFLSHQTATALDNGLALTPPMGWLSWARFLCEIDCTHKPLSCISESLYMAQADRLAEDGYRDAGYVFVNVDDCYLAKTRDAQGRLQWDPDRFPSGIPHLAKYVHDRGLKLGVYEDYGTETCAGYPGVLNHLKLDAETMASWDIDMLKLDGCNADPKTMDAGYPEFGTYLNKTGKQIIYSCSWPDYIRDELHIQPNYTLVGEYCNLWRNFDDIEISWQSILSIIDFYDANQATLVPAAGPGKWNDPDMLVIGNPGVTVDQAKAQFAIWAIYAAPLLMSNDLRFITKAQRDILLNRRIIAINQDRLGIMGRLVFTGAQIGVYLRPVTPVVSGDYSYGVAFLNRNEHQVNYRLQLSRINMTHAYGYQFDDLYTNEFVGIFKPTDFLNVTVKPTGVVMFKATAL